MSSSTSCLASVSQVCVIIISFLFFSKRMLLACVSSYIILEDWMVASPLLGTSTTIYCCFWSLCFPYCYWGCINLSKCCKILHIWLSCTQIDICSVWFQKAKCYSFMVNVKTAKIRIAFRDFSRHLHFLKMCVSYCWQQGCKEKTICHEGWGWATHWSRLVTAVFLEVWKLAVFKRA